MNTLSKLIGHFVVKVHLWDNYVRYILPLRDKLKKSFMSIFILTQGIEKSEQALLRKPSSLLTGLIKKGELHVR